MDDKNFILIQGWMVKHLNIDSKELFLFAIIYGFSQDKETSFKGSRKYISEILKCSVNHVSDLLNRLLNKKLIIKNSKIINNVQFNSYTVNFDEIEKLTKSNINKKMKI